MSDSLLVMVRDLPAPPERVFDSLTRAETIGRWWGGWPAGAERPAPEIDLRIGGRWRIPLSFGETVSWCTGTYREIRPPDRLAFGFAWEGQDGPEADVMIQLTELPEGGTRLRLEHDLSVVANGCAEGWDAQLGPLAELLAAR